jgi:arginyl-tRNA synthetase
VAQDIIARLDSADLFETVEVAGPGFINIRLRKEWLAGNLRAIAGEDRLGVELAQKPRTIVIDYSSPNVAKPMHVGHLRSTIIGDALARTLRFLGHKVISDNHLGDWGTQMGMLLYGYKNHLDRQALETDPVGEMARLYILVRSLIKPAEPEEEADPGEKKVRYTPEQVAQAQQILDRVREETAKLHAGDEENVRLWQTFMPWCHEELDSVYCRLDVSFDHTLGESFYNPMLPGVVEELIKAGVAVESEGAVVIPQGEKQPPSLVRKRDGAFTYTTTDLATIRYRVQNWKPDAILYVVDFRQSLHFQHLFSAARRWGYDQVELTHVSFGAMLGRDRKPIKTREGGSTPLHDLLNEAVARAAVVYQRLCDEARARGEEVPSFSPQELREIHEAVGIGAVKYADLCQNRTTDYVFDWDKMLSMDGNTATYMQYAYVRNRGILRKGGVDPVALRHSAPEILLETPYERALALQLLRFQEALEPVAEDYKPNAITSYLWDLAKTYTAFNVNCNVLKAETEALRQSRLLLCDLTARVIQKGLSLLGIRTVERM